MNRTLALAAVAALGLLASQADAQAISGTLTASFTRKDEAGVPHVSLSVRLVCGLTCEAGNPKSFGVSGFSAFLAASKEQSVGYIGTGLIWDVRHTGIADADIDSFPVGVNLIATASSATCMCGNRTGQGGFIDLFSQQVMIPPSVSLVLDELYVGESPVPNLIIQATPAPSETVEVKVDGAGVNKVFHFTSADFDVPDSGPVRPGSKLMSVNFTTPGKATITATVGGGPPFTKTYDVIAYP
jgi:hypothetical protein